MKIGRITTGVSLILLGILLFLRMTGQAPWADQMLQYWPAIVIGYGIEMLFSGRREGRLRFDWGGAILVFVVLMLVNAFTFGGGFRLGGFGPEKTIQAGPIIHEGGDLSALWVHSPNGEVTVMPSTDGKITVIPTYRLRTNDENGARQLMEERQVRVTENGNRLEVQVEWPKNQFSLFEWINASVDLKVYAPKEMLIEGESSNGSIAVTQMGKVGRIHTSNGDITLTDSMGKADIDTSNGRISVANFAGEIRAKTSNGSIEAGGEMKGDWNFHTSNGTIRINLPSASSIAYDLRTSNGSIDVPNPPFTGKKDEDHYAGVINGGENRLMADTSNGSIHIRFSDEGKASGSW